MQIGEMMQHVLFVNHDDAMLSMHQLFKAKAETLEVFIIDNRIVVDPTMVVFAEIKPC
jgi:hypothetical protein